MAGDKFIIEIDAKTIYDSIKDLGSKMDEMIKHQKTTNGRVTANEKSIEDNGIKIGQFNSFKDKAMMVWSGIILTGTFIINHYF